MTDGRISIQLVDDHEVVRAGFRHLLEREGDIEVVAEADCGKQACRDYDHYQPDIVIMDVSLPDISGLEAMRRILVAHPKARILMLSMHGGMVAEHAIRMGARGYLSKRHGASELTMAIRTIMQGEIYSSADQAKPANKAGSDLTRRELEVVMLLAAGKSVADIAKLLHIDIKTVYTHRKHVMGKLGVSTDVDLVQLVGRMGLGSEG